MKMIALLYFGFLALGLTLAYFAYTNYVHSKDLVNNGIKTTATVIDLLTVAGDDGNTYKPVFEFKDRSDRVITFESEISSSPPSYRIGEKVDILYDPDDNDRKVVSFWGLYRWSIVLMCIASPLLIIGGGYVLYTQGWL